MQELGRDPEATETTAAVLYEVARERARQDAKWGQPNHPNGTGPDARITLPRERQWYYAATLANWFRSVCKANVPGQDNWRDILLEEVFEALAETDPGNLRTELVQVAAVAVAWIEKIDREAVNG